jgi:hypothetical protein
VIAADLRVAARVADQRHLRRTAGQRAGDAPPHAVQDVGLFDLAAMRKLQPDARTRRRTAP